MEGKGEEGETKWKSGVNEMAASLFPLKQD